MRPSPGRRTRVRVEGLVKPWGRSTEVRFNLFRRVANEHKEEVLKLGEGMLPYLRTVLARQRRDYGIDEERFPSQYPVESQAANIDQTPVHNLAAERACGKIDYRIKRTHSLPPVSRQMILQR